MIWAEHSRTADKNQKHSAYGSMKLSLSASGATIVSTITLSDKDFHYFIHGILMWASWGGFGFFMFLSNRWLSHMSDYVQYAHSLFGFLMTLTSIGSLIHLVAVGEFEIEYFHSLFGFVVIVGSIAATILGMYTYKSKQDQKWNTAHTLRFRNIHNWVSRIILLLSLHVIGSGVFEFCGDNPEFDRYRWIPFTIYFWWILYISCEICFRMMRYREDKIPSLEKYDVMTEEEFSNRI
jgi:hypothetical protein